MKNSLSITETVNRSTYNEKKWITKYIYISIILGIVAGFLTILLSKDFQKALAIFITLSGIVPLIVVLIFFPFVYFRNLIKMKFFIKTYTFEYNSELFTININSKNIAFILLENFIDYKLINEYINGAGPKEILEIKHYKNNSEKIIKTRIMLKYFSEKDINKIMTFMRTFFSFAKTQKKY